jgi:Chaperone of endosialidase
VHYSLIIPGSNNVAIGGSALVNNMSGNFNIAVGAGAGSGIISAFNCIAIGHQGAAVNQSCFIGNIRGAVVAPDAVSVLIDSAGKLGTTSGSSRRFKKEIKPMDKTSGAILALNPVTFQYKDDKANSPQFGLIAEEVAKINRDLVMRDDNGGIYSVRYDAVNAMLLNEFLKEHRKNEEQQVTIARQQKQIEALTADLQNVSAQIQLIKSAPRTALNTP